jgi:DNA-binding protein HU-beta
MPAPKKPLTKTQIIAELAERSGVPKKAMSEIMDNFTDLAYEETKRAGSFTIPGIGKMKKVSRKARDGRNPATGEKIRIPAKTTAKVTMSKAAKDAVL